MKTTGLPQFTVKLYHIMLYRAYLAMSEIRTRNIIGNSNDCIISCKSNYHTIRATATRKPCPLNIANMLSIKISSSKLTANLFIINWCKLAFYVQGVLHSTYTRNTFPSHSHVFDSSCTPSGRLFWRIR